MGKEAAGEGHGSDEDGCGGGITNGDDSHERGGRQRKTP